MWRRGASDQVAIGCALDLEPAVLPGSGDDRRVAGRPGHREHSLFAIEHALTDRLPRRRLNQELTTVSNPSDELARRGGTAHPIRGDRIARAALWRSPSVDVNAIMCPDAATIRRAAASWTPIG